MRSASVRADNRGFQSSQPLFDWKIDLALVVGAFAVLLLGTSVYVLDRAPGAIAFFPPSWTGRGGTTPIWGSLGGFFPSFAHSFAFSVFAGLAVGPRWRLRVCAAWAAVGTLFEFGQHPAIAAHIAEMLRKTADGVPGTAQLAAYFTNGRFDSLDVLLTCIGAASAAMAFTLAGHWQHRDDRQQSVAP